MSTYVTKQGDMWDTIALSEYESLSAVPDLMMANTKYINTHVFPAGVSLDIPEFDDDDDSNGIELPPWIEADEFDEEEDE